jgi:hypothetical protein
MHFRVKNTLKNNRYYTLKHHQHLGGYINYFLFSIFTQCNDDKTKSKHLDESFLRF